MKKRKAWFLQWSGDSTRWYGDCEHWMRSGVKAGMTVSTVVAYGPRAYCVGCDLGYKH